MMNKHLMTAELIERAARAIRWEPTVPGAGNADAIWQAHAARSARAARRVRNLAVLSVAALGLSGGAIAFAGVDGAFYAVRVVMARLNIIQIDEFGRAHQSEISVEAVEGHSTFDAILMDGVGPGEVRAGVLVEDARSADSIQDESGLTVRGYGADGSVSGVVTISPDGRTMSSTGDAFIIVNSGPKIRPDVNGDGLVDTQDLAAVLRAIGAEERCPEDTNADDRVDHQDLKIVIEEFNN